MGDKYKGLEEKMNVRIARYAFDIADLAICMHFGGAFVWNHNIFPEKELGIIAMNYLQKNGNKKEQKRIPKQLKYWTKNYDLIRKELVGW